MKYTDIVDKVAEELNIPKEIVTKVYRCYWKSIKDIIQNLSLKDNLSDEQFNSLQTSINIPSLGKLSCTMDKYIRTKKRHILIKELKSR